MNAVLERSDVEQRTGWAKSNAIEQGHLALGCMASISGMDLDKKLAMLGPYGFVKNLLFELYYNAFEDPSQVARLCEIANQRTNNRRQLIEEQDQKGSRTVPRRLGDPAKVEYPGTMSTSYSEWASNRVGTYLNNGDVGSRANVGQLTDGLLDPVTQLQTEIITDGLALSEATVAVICNVLGIVEVGFDPGDACRIISSSIGVARVVDEIALQTLQWEGRRVRTHNVLIDEAEIQATHTDSARLASTAAR